MFFAFISIESFVIMVGILSSLVPVTHLFTTRAVWIINLLGIRGDNEDSSKTSNHNNHNRKTKPLRIINDRKILEFLLSHDGRNIVHANGIDGLAEIDIINHLDILSIKKIKCDTTTSKGAELLMDIRNPCLIMDCLNRKSLGLLY